MLCISVVKEILHCKALCDVKSRINPCFSHHGRGSKLLLVLITFRVFPGRTLKIFEFRCSTLKVRKLMKGTPLATICFEFLSVLALWIIVASQSQRMPSGITHLIPTLVTFSPSFFFSWFLRLQSQLFYHSHSLCQNLFREGQEPQISWDTFH